MDAPRALLAVLFIVTLVSGCTLTNQTVPVGYVPETIPRLAVISEQSPSVTVDVIEDKRAVNDPKLLFHKKNMYGVTMSGGYLAEKPVASIIRDALAELLEPDSASNAPAKYRLSGKLQDLDYEIVQGFWSSQANSKLTVQLYLTNVSTNAIEWSESFVGHGRIEKIKGENAAVRDMLTKALDDVVEQVRASSVLSNLLRGTQG